MEQKAALEARVIPSDGVLSGAISEERVLVLPAKFWRDAKQFLEKSYGKSVNLVLSKFAEEFGRKYAEKLRARGMTPEETFDSLQKMAAVGGWGAVTVTGDIGGGGALLVDVKGCAFCAANRVPGEPCDFMAGVAVGTADAIYGKEYVCEHVDVGPGTELHCALRLQKARRPVNPEWKTAANFPWMIERT